MNTPLIRNYKVDFGRIDPEGRRQEIVIRANSVEVLSVAGTVFLCFRDTMGRTNPEMTVAVVPLEGVMSMTSG